MCRLRFSWKVEKTASIKNSFPPNRTTLPNQFKFLNFLSFPLLSQTSFLCKFPVMASQDSGNTTPLSAIPLSTAPPQVPSKRLRGQTPTHLLPLAKARLQDHFQTHPCSSKVKNSFLMPTLHLPCPRRTFETPENDTKFRKLTISDDHLPPKGCTNV